MKSLHEKITNHSQTLLELSNLKIIHENCEKEIRLLKTEKEVSKAKIQQLGIENKDLAEQKQESTNAFDELQTRFNNLEQRSKSNADLMVKSLSDKYDKLVKEKDNILKGYRGLEAKYNDLETAKADCDKRILRDIEMIEKITIEKNDLSSDLEARTNELKTKTEVHIAVTM